MVATPTVRSTARNKVIRSSVPNKEPRTGGDDESNTGYIGCGTACRSSLRSADLCSTRAARILPQQLYARQDAWGPADRRLPSQRWSLAEDGSRHDGCAGDIANLNGSLSCNRVPNEGYGFSERRAWREGYGSSQPYEWRDEYATRCSAIYDPYERERCWRGW